MEKSVLWYFLCNTWEQSAIHLFYYRPQTKFAKVMFLQVCVCPRGGRACFLGGGHACFPGVCGCRGGMCGWGCAWLWGACMVAGGVSGCRGACMVVGGHAWLQGGRVWDMTRYGQLAGGSHPTGMHYCFVKF